MIPPPLSEAVPVCPHPARPPDLRATGPAATARTASPLSLVLLGLGVFLLVLAPMLAWYVEPRAKVTPVDVDVTTVFTGNGSYFDTAALRDQGPAEDHHHPACAGRCRGEREERAGGRVGRLHHGRHPEDAGPEGSAQGVPVDHRALGHRPAQQHAGALLRGGPDPLRRRCLPQVPLRCAADGPTAGGTTPWAPPSRSASPAPRRSRATRATASPGPSRPPGPVAGRCRADWSAGRGRARSRPRSGTRTPAIELVVEQRTGRIINASISPHKTLRAPGARRDAVTLLRGEQLEFTPATQRRRSSWRRRTAANWRWSAGRCRSGPRRWAGCSRRPGWCWWCVEGAPDRSWGSPRSRDVGREEPERVQPTGRF